MKKILLPTILLLFIACDREFEPELKTGWKAYTLPGRGLVHVEINGREVMVPLPGDEQIGYRFVQWTKQDQILLTQILKTESCYDYQIISIDTTGAIIDTIYTAPPNTPINFRLAPNDSLLLLKTYDDNCEDESDNFRYTFYNRYSKTALPDTIEVANARGLLLPETVWSPDSKSVIISEWWSGRLQKAFVYDLVTKDTTHIDKGTKFIWSPTDNDLVTYLKDYSVHSKNIKTGEKVVIYEGKSKKGVTDFRWNPTGDFLMLHRRSYLLNVDIPMLQRNIIIYFSVKDNTESREYFDDQRIDTWKEAAR